MAIEVDLRKLWHERERELGITLRVSDVAGACDLDNHTVARMLRGETRQFQSHVLERLCEFFRCEKGPIPFVIYEPDWE
jgi:DNA-binding Xre family transcriptional regulator